VADIRKFEGFTDVLNALKRLGFTYELTGHDISDFRNLESMIIRATENEMLDEDILTEMYDAIERVPIRKENIMQKDGIKVEGHIGTWYVIDESYYRGKKVYLLEHEEHGDEAASVIIYENLNIVMEDVRNGFSDLERL